MFTLQHRNDRDQRSRRLEPQHQDICFRKVNLPQNMLIRKKEAVTLK